MAAQNRDSGAGAADSAIRRARELNDRILDQARRGGEASLAAYERLLKTVADLQETAGGRSGEWLTQLGRAQAAFTRELAEAYPAAAKAIGERMVEFTEAAARQVRRVPGATEAEGEVRGAAAVEEDLPIANYDDLNVREVNERLERLSEPDLGKVDAYERRHANRKTVRQRIAALRGQ